MFICVMMRIFYRRCASLFRKTCRFGVKRHGYLYKDTHFLQTMCIFTHINMSFYTKKSASAESYELVCTYVVIKIYSPSGFTNLFRVLLFTCEDRILYKMQRTYMARCINENFAHKFYKIVHLRESPPPQ